MALTWTEGALASMVTDLTQAAGGGAVAGVLHGAKMFLFTNSPALTPTTALAALTQPTYAGYVPPVLTWGAAVRDIGGRIVTESQVAEWQMTDALTPTVVRGWGIMDGAGAVLIAADFLPAPVALNTALDAFGVIARVAPMFPEESSAIVIG